MSDPFHDVRAPGLEARTCGGTHDACLEMDRLSQLLCDCDNGVLSGAGLHGQPPLPSGWDALTSCSTH